MMILSSYVPYPELYSLEGPWYDKLGIGSRSILSMGLQIGVGCLEGEAIQQRINRNVPTTP
jgi:hypothetical protein